MPQPSKTSYDFALTIDGVRWPIFVAKQNGVKQWGDGLAPMVAPQVRMGKFGEDHIPPEIEVLESVEKFTGGAGYATSDDVNTVYNYARGLDASWEDRVFVSLQRRATLESDGTAIAAAPVKFYQSSYGLYMLAGAYIYKWDLSSATWVERRNSSGTFSGAAYKDMTELDGVLYASRGSSADYDYSTDGTTFAAFTDADENADVFTQRGNGSDVAAVWKVLTNVIKTTTSGINGGVAWAGSDEAGNTGETVQSIVTVDNDIYVFKKEGFYRYDGVNTQDVWKTQYIASSNGKNAYLHANGKIYVTYGRRLLEYDPYGDTALTPIYPVDGMDSLELLGDITAIGGSDTHVKFAVKNRAGNTYLMRGRKRGGEWAWHPTNYLGANDCNALLDVGPGAMHTTHPASVFGYGSAASYVVLPRENMLPVDDPTVTFETTEGQLYGSYVDYGSKTIPKFLNRGMVLGYGVSASRYATLKYEIDRNGTETTLVSATTSGTTEANTASEVSFNLLRPIIYMATGDTAASPSIDAFTVGATLNPRRKRLWNPVVELSEDDEFRGGGITSSLASVDTQRRALFGAVRKRITLTDRAHIDYTVRLLDIQPVGLYDKESGGAESDSVGYQLTLVEITTLTSDATTGIYDESVYDGTHVYS